MTTATRAGAFLPDAPGDADPTQVIVEVPASTAVEIKDVVAELFGESRAGALRFRSEYPFDVRSRTFNDGGVTGTFGQGIAGLSPDAAIEGGVHLGAANRPGSDGVRTNLRFVNTGDVAEDVLVGVIDQDTQEFLVGFERIEVGPNGWYQGNVFELVGAADREVDNALVLAISGHGTILSYISRVDNRSGDGTYNPPFDGASVWIIPAEWRVTIILHYSPGVTMTSITFTGSDGVDVTVEAPEDGWSQDLTFTSPTNFCYSVVRMRDDTGGHIEVEVLSGRDGEAPASNRHTEGALGAGVIAFDKCIELY